MGPDYTYPGPSNKPILHIYLPTHILLRLLLNIRDCLILRDWYGVSVKMQLQTDELTTIVGPLAAANKILSVSLFGSRATGKYTRKSDYDFLIEVNKDFTFDEYYRFSDGLQAALGTSVDIVFTDTLNDDYFSRRVTSEAILIWQRSGSD